MTITSSSKNELLPKWVSPFTIVTIFVVVTLCGVLLAPMLPFRLYPNPGKGSLYVNFSYYGATAEAVELEVTSVLEGRLSLIEGVEGVSSVSGDGWGQVKGISADAAPAFTKPPAVPALIMMDGESSSMVFSALTVAP